jgi:hypothetical protein
MKKLLLSTLIGFMAMTFLSGCVNLQLGGGTTSKPLTPTVGQQLIDLQHAKDARIITEQEYQAQKARILENR